MRIETEIHENGEDGSRIYKQRSYQDVYNDIDKALKEEGLYPDEYMSMAYDLSRRADRPFPEIAKLFCGAEWGSSEGIYLNVIIYAFIPEMDEPVRIPFLTGKSLSETEEEFDRMQYIGGRIYRMLMGERQVHARYVLQRVPRYDKSSLDEKLTREFRDLLRKKLYHMQGEALQDTEELSLKAMILKTITSNPLPEDKTKELLEAEDALELLYCLCGHVMQANYYEIEDTIASVQNFSAAKLLYNKEDETEIKEKLLALAKKISKAGRSIAQDPIMKEHNIGYSDTDTIIVKSDSGYEGIYIGTMGRSSRDGFMCLYTNSTEERNSFPDTQEIANLLYDVVCQRKLPTGEGWAAYFNWREFGGLKKQLVYFSKVVCKMAGISNRYTRN